jgi:hypothetical protein
MEAVVDAYDTEERAMGWYYYLDDKLHLPFQARCIEKRGISPLRIGEEVEVLGMTSESQSLRDMFVDVHWQDRRFGVPLAQLEAIDGDEETEEGIADWHYWCAREYEF